MTRLSAAMVRMLARVPDPPDHLVELDHHAQVTLYCLERRGLVERRASISREYTRTPFGRETAEKLARGR